MSVPVLPEERVAAIRARLDRDGRVVAAELARALGATEDTIRCDLRELAARGLCRRVYGGALPAKAGLTVAANSPSIAGDTLDAIVVEQDADPAWLARFREVGVDVRRAA